MASIHFYAFISVDPKTGKETVHSGYKNKAEAHRSRLKVFDMGEDVGGISRISLALPNSRGTSSLLHSDDQ